MRSGFQRWGKPDRVCGEDCEFLITLAGTGPFTCQWRQNGASLSSAASSSAVTATLTVPVQRLTDRGQYDCAVTNGCGSNGSAAATLTIGCACSLANVAGGGPNALLPDGVIDGDDFVAFINAFSTGC